MLDAQEAEFYTQWPLCKHLLKLPSQITPLTLMHKPCELEIYKTMTILRLALEI
jgi:hypothetical protein